MSLFIMTVMKMLKLTRREIFSQEVVQKLDFSSTIFGPHFYFNPTCVRVPVMCTPDNKYNKVTVDLVLFLYLLWCDALNHALLHPVHHVLLLHAAVKVLKLHLIVQPLLHLIGHHVQTLSVVDLQQHSHVILMEDWMKIIRNLHLAPV